MATGPCQVWSWDITYLRTNVKGMFFYLYMFVDVWSRKIVAAKVFEEESMEHSAPSVEASSTTKKFTMSLLNNFLQYARILQRCAFQRDRLPQRQVRLNYYYFWPYSFLSFALVPRLINSVVDFGNLGYSCTGI